MQTAGHYISRPLMSRHRKSHECVWATVCSFLSIHVCPHEVLAPTNLPTSCGGGGQYQPNFRLLGQHQPSFQQDVGEEASTNQTSYLGVSTNQPPDRLWRKRSVPAKLLTGAVSTNQTSDVAVNTSQNSGGSQHQSNA